MSLPHLPILRHGVPYTSLDVAEIPNVATGEPAIRVSQANSGLIGRDLKQSRASRDALRRIPIAERIAMVKRAGDIFQNDTLPLGEDGQTQSPDDYVRQLATTSGLPYALIRMNMKRLGGIFADIDTILRGLTRGMDLDVLDRGYGTQGGAPVAYHCVTDNLAVILPSNSPAVNALWIPAIALGVPVILKPGREEPWTPWRVIQALIKAGIPREAFSYYPTGHDGSGLLLRHAGRVMMFGDDATVAQYAADPRVEVHGSGRSKILIGEDKIEQWRDYLPLMVESVSANSGRSCINASAILVPRYAEEIAAALAKELLPMVPRATDDPDARLSGFANPAMPEWIDSTITEGLTTPGATDLSATLRSPSSGGPDGSSPSTRRATRDGMNYLLPTIIHCPAFDHPLANREFLFPFASVTAAPQSEMLNLIGPSLVVTAITDDKAWIEELLESPHIDRLNIGPTPTNRVQWDQPHEGNLFEFLYKRRSIGLTEQFKAA
ncbi:MAG TPA: aldehyde dehydrogenase family protein [Verrucomicrobiales bacterium]|nr:aldehyde dehydrogenase family protein [Verrucomicrobiales bacterium]